ncbi:MAG TPA: sensor histidine kinase [Thermomicrobiales bacterium]|nr:sensor histidine kinase [Thermomicrobiales bacterium]
MSIPSSGEPAVPTSLAGRRPRFFYLVSVPLWGATLIRTFDDEGDASRLPVTLPLLALYLALFFTESWLSRRFPRYQQIYFGLQVAIGFALMTSQPDLDFYAILFLPICAQIALVPQRRERQLWFCATYAAMAVGLLLYQDFPRSVALILLYGAGYLLVASYAAATEQAEAAEAQSRALVGDLQQANRQLTENAETIEELAVVQERNRLARELHDSVSQSLYGLVLSAEAARRNLAAGNTATSAGELESMSATARATLAEMRLLIYELRPSEIEEHGLQRALETRLATVERRAGLQTSFEYAVSADVPMRIEIELERIATEALTNAVRHAGATAVSVRVRQESDRLVLEVRDDGAGLVPGAAGGGFGIRGMRERAERLDGRFSIDSTAGSGTVVRVEAPL